jgi:hypothetical protein
MLIIDRFEGGFAVVETNAGMISIPRADLPANVKEGDALKIIIDADETKYRKRRIECKMRNLFKV